VRLAALAGKFEELLGFMLVGPAIDTAKGEIGRRAAVGSREVLNACPPIETRRQCTIPGNFASFPIQSCRPRATRRIAQIAGALKPTETGLDVGRRSFAMSQDQP
jgi:hypothetical protein